MYIVLENIGRDEVCLELVSKGMLFFTIDEAKEFIKEDMKQKLGYADEPELDGFFGDFYVFKMDQILHPVVSQKIKIKFDEVING